MNVTQSMNYTKEISCLSGFDFVSSSMLIIDTLVLDLGLSDRGWTH